MIYDLRSDTITKPSRGMRKAMYMADVGDDVFGEDPTVNRLQDMAARIMEKEAGLFITSGSMGNLISIYLNCGRGNEVIAHHLSHIFLYELGSLSVLAGAFPAPVYGNRGIVDPEAAELCIRPDIYYLPRTKMISIENSHNSAGGTCYTLEELQALRRLANRFDLKIHLDGARIFNALTATDLSSSEAASCVDTVAFCLSKGLGAPVGSVLCGTKEFISEARRLRKMLGGGMRQAGVLAAAGIYALENNIKRLAEDHNHARMITSALNECDWAEVDTASVETNIIYFHTTSYNANDVVESLAQAGILALATSEKQVRMVTSLAVTSEDVKAVCGILKNLAL